MPQVIVVGSGVAGLVAALTASVTHDVTLVTKATLSASNTFYAQGGIAAALFDDDSVAEHMADTLRAGAGLNDSDAVRALCTEGPDRIRDLIRFGVEFDRSGGQLARGMEAAHSHARVLHAGGDATGAAIETALVGAVQASGVTVLEHTFVTDLVARDGSVVGVEVLRADGCIARLEADAVILASGGAGQLYRHTTNPEIATGDGVAAAWRAGAVLADTEFYQFHPTALAVPGNFLVSEAVRGEGAFLVNQAGERFMTDVHPDAELAPRDVVAHGIAIEMAAQGGAPVLLDATGLGAELLTTRFPTISAACRAAGLDWTRDPIPVTPAAHYWMGGVATDTWGRTSLPGLYAVGEVACTGAHGANRLASNSLLESVVFAHRTIQALDMHRSLSLSKGSATTPLLVPNSANPHAPFAPHRAADRSFGSFGLTTWAQLRERGDDLRERGQFSRTALQNLMWNAAGVHRSGSGLETAADTLAGWRAPGPAEASVTAYEDANLLDVARVLVAQALGRLESRGAHFRSDYPTTSLEFAHHLRTQRSAEREATIAC